MATPEIIPIAARDHDNLPHFQAALQECDTLSADVAKLDVGDTVLAQPLIDDARSHLADGTPLLARETA